MSKLFYNKNLTELMTQLDIMSITFNVQQNNKIKKTAVTKVHSLTIDR